MIRPRVLLVTSCVGVLCLVAAGDLRADAIDGNWCAPDGRVFSIDGPRIITPGGHALDGDYSRHAFAYVAPPGEDGAGSQVLMQLLNEQTVRILAGLAPEIWRRCDVTS